LAKSPRSGGIVLGAPRPPRLKDRHARHNGPKS